MAVAADRRARRCGRHAGARDDPARRPREPRAARHRAWRACRPAAARQPRRAVEARRAACRGFVARPQRRPARRDEDVARGDRARRRGDQRARLYPGRRRRDGADGAGAGGACRARRAGDPRAAAADLRRAARDRRPRLARLDRRRPAGRARGHRRARRLLAGGRDRGARGRFRQELSDDAGVAARAAHPTQRGMGRVDRRAPAGPARCSSRSVPAISADRAASSRCSRRRG